MNGYKMSADAYRDYLAEENPPGKIRAGVERKIKALDFMASTDRETQYELFNSGGFNYIVRGYFLMALDNARIEEEERAAIMREIRFLFDTVTADQAEAYYMTH